MQSLNDLMQFDHVIRVSEDGTITDVSRPYPPDCYTHYDQSTTLWSEPILDQDDGWKLLTGFTGQYGYNGAAMHQSEYIGGGLEAHIRKNPGYYVSLAVYPVCDCSEDDACWLGHDSIDDQYSWVVAYREL